jgi:hypothetical protein
MTPFKHLPAATLSIILLCACALLSCDSGNSAESALQDYLTRVQNATDVDGELSEPATLLTYPSRRDRSVRIEEIRIGLIDFFSFYDCDLFRLVNERNSNLGKIMPISQRLVYEIKFLRAAEACEHQLAAQPDDNEGFRRQLRDVIVLKKTTLPRVFWNATFDSDEMQKAFSLAVSPLNLNDETAYAGSRQALGYLQGVSNVLTDPSTDVSIDQLETHYYALQRGRYGGRLLQSMAQLTRYLDAAAHSLEAVLQDRTLCFQRKPTKQAKILLTVLTKFYGSRIQPYLSRIHQQGRSWLIAVNALIDRPGIPIPVAFARYRERMLSLEHDGSIWIQFERAVSRHTKAWQALLKHCGLRLGEAEKSAGR